MKLFSLKNAVLATAVGFITFAGAGSADAQNREYRDWQRAQREAEEERREYMRSGSSRDYREWQRAQREAQRELRDYRREVRENRRDMNRAYNRYNNRYNNRSYGTYRLYRDGRYYTIDQRGADLLRQAVNSGYQQGYNQGLMDRRYGRGGGYYNSNIYRSGTYGYQSYVDRSQYQYYFQQGFQRGYEDGLNSQMRYGYRSGNSFNILGGILNTILNLANN